MKRIKQLSKSFLAIPILVSLIFSLAGCTPQDSVTRGGKSALIERLAPDFTLRDLKGNQVSLSDFRGQPVVLNFWATWCSPCRVEIPHLEALYTKYKDQGLVVIGMNVETDYMKVKHFAESRISYTVLLDGSTQSQGYDISGIPCTYYIDREGIVRHRSVGFAPGGEVLIEEKIKELLADSDD